MEEHGERVKEEAKKPQEVQPAAAPAEHASPEGEAEGAREDREGAYGEAVAEAVKDVHG